METYIQWDTQDGWEQSDVQIQDEYFVVGLIYFENEQYQLIAHEKDEEAYYLVAEWKK